MSTDKKFNWWDALSILGAVGTFGVGWIADNESTMVAFLAVGIVYLLGLGFSHFKFKLNKAGLTVLVFLVAFALSFIIQGVVLPVFPAWNGDASIFAPLLIAYLTALLQSVAGVVAYATGVYNILLAKVLEKLPYAISSAVASLLILIVLFVLVL